MSPDGSQLAFVAIAGDGSKKIWVRDLSDITARPLPETSGAWYPFWSPDGRYLAFFADGKLKRIDLRGGAPQVIAEAPSGRGGSETGRTEVDIRPVSGSFEQWQVSIGGGSQPCWRGDGRELFYVSPDGQRFLLNVPVAARLSVGFHVIVNWRSLLEPHRD